MKYLYAPWRNSYTKEEQEQNTKKECIFCSHITENNDKKNFIIKRYTHGLVMLNLYPYNPGHLLIVPYRHTPGLEQLTQEERLEFMNLIALSANLLQKVLKAHGINTGLNMGGKAAGGSVPEHIHIHVIPRWLGDTNFLAIIAETKVITLDLPMVYQELYEAFNAQQNF